MKVRAASEYPVDLLTDYTCSEVKSGWLCLSPCVKPEEKADRDFIQPISKTTFWNSTITVKTALVVRHFQVGSGMGLSCKETVSQ